VRLEGQEGEWREWREGQEGREREGRTGGKAERGTLRASSLLSRRRLTKVKPAVRIKAVRITAWRS
jgi:hypothetical protein